MTLKGTLNKANTVIKGKNSVGRVNFVTELPESPNHIKYRYYAVINEEKDIERIGLECVTKIDGDYVSFKEIFNISLKEKSDYHPSIKEHLDLFLNLISIEHNDLIFE